MVIWAGCTAPEALSLTLSLSRSLSLSLSFSGFLWLSLSLSLLKSTPVSLTAKQYVGPNDVDGDDDGDDALACLPP